MQKEKDKVILQGMISSEYIRLFNFFNQYFNIDRTNAETFVSGVEHIVENKFDAEKNNFSSRKDIQELKYQIELLRQETKTAIAEGNNKLIIWIVSTGIAIIGLILAFLKL